MSDISRGNTGINGIIDSSNSTTSNLTASSVYTGTFVEILDFAHITVLVRSNVASATNGLEIQWSADGSTVHDTDKFTIPADTGKIVTFGPQSRYYRVKYTNGGTNQSSFIVQSILHKLFQKSSSHRLSDTLSNQDDVEVVKAVLAGDSGDGSLRNVGIDTSGRLLVSENAATPADTAEVTRTAKSSTNSTSGDDTTYTITNGKTLVLQIFEAGAESNSVGGSVIELFDDINGNGTGMNIISTIYVNGSSFQNTVATELLGDGTRRVLMRRRVFSGSSREVYGRWKGFERD